MTLENQEIRKKYSIAEDLYNEETDQAAVGQEKIVGEKSPDEAELTSEKLESISDEIDAILEEDLDQVEEEFESSGFPPAPAELTDQELDDITPVEKEMPDPNMREEGYVSESAEQAPEEVMDGMGAEEVVDEQEAPSSGAAAGEEAVGIDDATSQAITEYVQTIQKKISRAISFPMEAKEQGWEGTVVLSLVILNDGTLNDARIQTSSGREAFDKDAINTARILAPFSSFPEALKLEELVVTIPIVYSQEAVLEGTGVE